MNGPSPGQMPDSFKFNSKLPEWKHLKFLENISEFIRVNQSVPYLGRFHPTYVCSPKFPLLSRITLTYISFQVQEATSHVSHTPFIHICKYNMEWKCISTTWSNLTFSIMVVSANLMSNHWSSFKHEKYSIYNFYRHICFHISKKVFILKKL